MSEAGRAGRTLRTPPCAVDQALPDTPHFSRGAAKAALYCAHRTSTFLSCTLREHGTTRVSFQSTSSCAFHLLLGRRAKWSPTAGNVLTRLPTGRYFSPALPSDCFGIDFPGHAINPGEGLPRPRVARAQEINSLHPLHFPNHRLRGAAKAALYCAHRTIYLLPPSLLARSLFGDGA